MALCRTVLCQCYVDWLLKSSVTCRIRGFRGISYIQQLQALKIRGVFARALAVPVTGLTGSRIVTVPVVNVGDNVRQALNRQQLYRALSMSQGIHCIYYLYFPSL